LVCQLALKDAHVQLRPLVNALEPAVAGLA
jgi:hypothetical protein